MTKPTAGAQNRMTGTITGAENHMTDLNKGHSTAAETADPMAQDRTLQPKIHPVHQPATTILCQFPVHIPEAQNQGACQTAVQGILMLEGHMATGADMLRHPQVVHLASLLFLLRTPLTGLVHNLSLAIQHTHTSKKLMWLHGVLLC